MNQLRLPNGRFTVQSELNRKRRYLENFSKKKKFKQANVPETENSNDTCEDGSRIANVKQFGTNLKCSKCNELLNLEKVTREKRFDLNSIITINCEKCKETNSVSTGTISTSDNGKYYNINTIAVLGAVHSGVEILTEKLENGKPKIIKDNKVLKKIINTNIK